MFSHQTPASNSGLARGGGFPIPGKVTEFKMTKSWGTEMGSARLWAPAQSGAGAPLRLGGSDILSKRPPGGLPLEDCRARPVVGSPGVDQEHRVEIISVVWPGKGLGSPWRSWNTQLEGAMSRLLCCKRRESSSSNERI